MEAKKAQQQADALREALTEITTQLSLAEVLRKILDSLKKVLSYDSATLFLKLDGEIKIVAARGFENTGLLINRTFPSNHKLILAIDEVRKPLIIKDASQDPRFEKWDIKEHSRSWMGIPLIRNHITIGYLTLDNNQPDIYTEEDANTAQLFANGAAIVIENAKLYEKSQQLATSDALTSIFNRRHFYELALTEFERSKRYKAHLSVIMLDIDHFKYINDKYGHLTGDQILISFVQRVQAELRTSDVFARYGGEEFIILLPETDNRQAIQVAERLRVVTAEKPFTNNQTSPYITISLGVATLDDSCDNLDTLIDRSDKALYEAKQIGRNRVRSWNH
jgi:diguanylate cyclase (GGDEF)-like protein